jgi:predicted enzyme related to lactoylglutathione lyase
MPANSLSSSLGLLVIRSDDLERAAEFYSAIGLQLVKHSHPPCGVHYSTTNSPCVFEICQREEGQSPTTSVFFGINVESIDNALRLVPDKGGRIKAAAKDSDWGRMATVSDPDGHSLMLIERRR